MTDILKRHYKVVGILKAAFPPDTANPSNTVKVLTGEQRFNKGISTTPIITVIYRSKAYPENRGYTRASPPNIYVDVEVYSTDYDMAIEHVVTAMNAVRKDKTLGIPDDDITITTSQPGQMDTYSVYVMSFTVRV